VPPDPVDAPGRLPEPVSLRVGMVGGGQLARMTHQAGISLGVRFRLLAEAPGTSAALVAPDVSVGQPDTATLLAFAADCDVITLDHDHVSPDALRAVRETGVAVAPGPEALVYAHDKAAMRERLTALGLPCPRWRVVDDLAAARAFAAEIEAAVVLKTSRGGYDGKGVWLPGPDGVPDVEAGAGPFDSGVPVLAEELVAFDRELSALVARSASGQAVAYPVVESVQRGGICVEVTAPAPKLDPELAAYAQQVALRIAGELGVVGLLAVELFQTGDRIAVNELAMRPHNTGHWTMDGAVTSQFENHLRAVCDLPLGSPAARSPWTVMVNVLGGSVPDLPSGLRHIQARDPALRVHLYDKSVVPGRKVGHVNVSGDGVSPGETLPELRARARHAADWFAGRIEE
jgi:5-(carboxyamino)imidazole ribonucleotide synthase